MIRILFKQALDEKSFKEGRRITLNEVSEETGNFPAYIDQDFKRTGLQHEHGYDQCFV